MCAVLELCLFEGFISLHHFKFLKVCSSMMLQYVVLLGERSRLTGLGLRWYYPYDIIDSISSTGMILLLLTAPQTEEDIQGVAFACNDSHGSTCFKAVVFVYFHVWKTHSSGTFTLHTYLRSMTTIVMLLCIDVCMVCRHIHCYQTQRSVNPPPMPKAEGVNEKHFCSLARQPSRATSIATELRDSLARTTPYR